MASALRVTLLLLFVLPAAARADDPGAAFTPPPPNPSAGTTVPDPIHVEVGAIAAIPEGDLSDGVDTSFGLRLAASYWFSEYLSAGISFRYVFIKLDGAPSGASANYEDVGIGAQAQYPVIYGVRVFGEAELVEAHISGSFEGISDSGSGIGYLFRGGVKLDVTRTVAVIGAVSFSAANIEVEGETGKAKWLGLDVGVAFAF